MYGTEDADDVKLNDVLELVGALAIAPNIAAEAEAAEADGAANAAAAAAAAAGGPASPPPPRRPRRRHRRFHGGGARA